MTNNYQLVVEDANHERLDKYLSHQLSSMSRMHIKQLNDQQNILVNGRSVKLAYKVKPGDKIEVIDPPLAPLDLEAEDIPLDIRYEDQDVIVVNKPQGMVVHPAAGHANHTLVNALLHHTKDLAKSEQGFRPGIVHRIDKDTSGLLMIAKTPLARESLEAQLANKTNKRQYLAIVHGNFKIDHGTIDAPIGRNPNQRKEMAVVKTGKHAVTHFKVLEQYHGYSLIECELETGRTHQIRVHLKYIGHPLAGDPLYGPHKTLPGHGQFLHAKTLGFQHPRTGQWVEISAEVPPIFADTIAKLRKEAGL